MNLSTQLVELQDADGFAIETLLDAEPVKVTVMQQSRVMDHPIEDGSSISDFKILLPIEIEFSLIVDNGSAKDVYQNLVAGWKAATEYTIQTRIDTYTNMIIAAMPHDETVDMMSATAFALKFRQVIVVDTQYQSLPPAAVANADDTSTTDRGAVQPGSSIAYNLTSGLFK